MQSLDLIDENGFIALDSFDFETNFQDIAHLTVERKLDPVESWELMTGADILIGCDSSVSIVGGYLNPRGIKLFPHNLSSTLPASWFFYDRDSVQCGIDITEILKMSESS